MAFYGQQRKMIEGQFTQTIYGLIRDQKFGEAIAHLTIELQAWQLYLHGICLFQGEKLLQN